MSFTPSNREVLCAYFTNKTINPNTHNQNPRIFFFTVIHGCPPPQNLFSSISKPTNPSFFLQNHLSLTSSPHKPINILLCFFFFSHHLPWPPPPPKSLFPLFSHCLLQYMGNQTWSLIVWKELNVSHGWWVCGFRKRGREEEGKIDFRGGGNHGWRWNYYYYYYFFRKIGFWLCVFGFIVLFVKCSSDTSRLEGIKLSFMPAPY